MNIFTRALLITLLIAGFAALYTWLLVVHPLVALVLTGLVMFVGLFFAIYNELSW